MYSESERVKDMRIIKISDKFVDQRGLIANIFPSGVEIRSVLYITGIAGAIRGNHYHRKDEHYCYVTEGSITYGWIDEHGEKQTRLLGPGDMVHSPSEERHQFIFETAGAFIALATESREQEHYEEDTIRESF